LEVLCVLNDRLLVLSGDSGRVKCELKLPDLQAHDCIIVARLTDGAFVGDILLKDRYRTVWALGRDGNVLWKHEGNPGHFYGCTISTETGWTK
jgi:hypothetical protein